MSDFLQNILKRHSGELEVVKPRIRGTFEPPLDASINSIPTSLSVTTNEFTEDVSFPENTSINKIQPNTFNAHANLPESNQFKNQDKLVNKSQSDQTKIYPLHPNKNKLREFYSRDEDVNENHKIKSIGIHNHRDSKPNPEISKNKFVIPGSSSSETSTPVLSDKVKGFEENIILLKSISSETPIDPSGYNVNHIKPSNHSTAKSSESLKQFIGEIKKEKLSQTFSEEETKIPAEQVFLKNNFVKKIPNGDEAIPMEINSIQVNESIDNVKNKHLSADLPFTKESKILPLSHPLNKAENKFVSNFKTGNATDGLSRNTKYDKSKQKIIKQNNSYSKKSNSPETTIEMLTTNNFINENYGLMGFPTLKNEIKTNINSKIFNSSITETNQVIKINIGRIDVKAVAEDVTQQPKRKIIQSPKLSLSDYLQQRNEGKR